MITGRSYAEMGGLKKCMSGLIYIEMVFMRHDERVRLERAQWAEFEVPANERMDT